MYSPAQLADKLSLYIHMKKKTLTSSQFAHDDETLLLASIEKFITKLKEHSSDYKLQSSEIVHGLNLANHPEGGFYRRFYWTKEKSIIFYLLPAGCVSSWHRLKGTKETFKWMSGTTLSIPRIRRNFLCCGEDLVAQDKEDVVIIKGEQMDRCYDAEEWGDWFGAYATDGNNYSFVTCECMPPFEFSKFELATTQDLIQFRACNPNFNEIIGRLSLNIC